MRMDDRQKKNNTLITAVITALQNTTIRIISILTIIIILSLSIYSYSLSQLISSVIQRQESSHGLLVPFISAFFLWKQRNNIKKLTPEFALLPGSIIVILSLVILFMPENNVDNWLSAVSFFIMMAGLVMAFLGKKIFNKLSFSLFFLMTMIPLPKPLYVQIAEWMRSTSTDGSFWLSQLLGVPLERNGYSIHFPHTILYVDEACSGVRYLISYFIFGLAYAFFYKKSITSRTLVIVSIIPISVVAGIMRLSTIFLSVYYISAVMADKFPHILLSWFVFCVILIVIIFTDRKLSTDYERFRAE